jgi:cysteine desulfuration protein SufE
MTEIQDIVDTFEFLGDWEDRYRYLVELGEQLPAMSAELKTESNKVQGCVSEVWVRLAPSPRAPGTLELAGDSETAIIKGVVALIVAVCRDKTPQEILETDIDQLFDRLELAEHLSPNRHVGIYAIVGKINSQARSLASAAA